MSRRPSDSRCFRALRLALFVGAAGVATACGADETPLQADTWIRNVQVVDTKTGVVARKSAIGIRNDTIVVIIADDDVPVGSTAHMISGHEAYAIPGLWDAHVHVMQGGGAESLRRAARTLAHGITHVRDMGSSLADREWFLARVSDGTSPAPDVVSAGPTFWAFSLPYGDVQAKVLLEDSSATEQAVDSLANAGVEFIKVYAGFTPDRLARLTVAAARRGLRVAGHAQPGATLAEQAAMGVLTVEHLDFSTFGECSARANSYFERVIAARFRGSGEVVPEIYAAFADDVDTEACRASLRRAADAGLTLTPTLVVSYLPYASATDVAERLVGDERESCNVYLRDLAGLSDEQQQLLPAAGRRVMRVVLDAGLPVLAGSDAPALCSAPGESLVEELLLLEAAGLPPLAVLQSATLWPSRTLRPTAALGHLAEGVEAHVLLLRDNPLASASAYRHPVGLYTRGIWRDAAELMNLRDPSPDSDSTP